jgi:glutaredoxin 2
LKNIKNIALKPIEQAITQHKSNHFIINKNYEVVIPESQKTLFHPNYYDISSLKQLFPNEVEVNSLIFTHRLNALSTFLKKIGEESKVISKIIASIRKVEGELKIEPITGRIFDDFRNPILSRQLQYPGVKDTLKNFCAQMEIDKQHLLFKIENL